MACLRWASVKQGSARLTLVMVMIQSKGNEDVYENEVLINKQYFYLDNENKVKIHILLNL
jgi:hypothetical protein